MKVLFFYSMDQLINRVGKRFKRRLQRLFDNYLQRHPGLKPSYKRFAVSVGWSFFLAAQGLDMAYAEELSSGLEGNPEACVQTGLCEMKLELVDADDFSYIRDMSYDVAALLLEEATPTCDTQPFYNFMESRANLAYRLMNLDDDEAENESPNLVQLRLPDNLLQAKGTEMQSPVYLSKKKGMKIDIIRILNSIYELGMVNDANGGKITKQVYMETMGRALNYDLSTYDRDLSNSMASSVAIDKQTQIFKDLMEVHLSIYNSK